MLTHPGPMASDLDTCHDAVLSAPADDALWCALAAFHRAVGDPGAQYIDIQLPTVPLPIRGCARAYPSCALICAAMPGS